ncbi:hypothetical protein N9L47_13980, partial [Rhodobacteraceae bacterium]|nr:hypothetical protein [Paracoccaceae bacterium]
MLNTALIVLSTSYFTWYYTQFETSAIYPFDTTYATPSDAGAPGLIEDRLATDDGETLIVWRADAQPGKPTILYFSGNAGGLKAPADRFRSLTQAGFGVIAPAYRGSSGSTGMPDEQTLLNDARTIAAQMSEDAVILYGE